MNTKEIKELLVKDDNGLYPCPFCGGKGTKPRGAAPMVTRCSDGDCELSCYLISTKTWNTRALDLSALLTTIEGLEKEKALMAYTFESSLKREEITKDVIKVVEKFRDMISKDYKDGLDENNTIKALAGLTVTLDEIQYLQTQLTALTKERDDLIEANAKLRQEAEERKDIFDFKAYLEVQIKWSEIVFGKGMRTEGILKHIALESDEVREEPNELEEWVDIIILALDGAWRSGATPDEIILKMFYKQQKNLRRKWHVPESENKPVKHIANPPNLGE
jgi:hypothetical protein